MYPNPQPLIWPTRLMVLVWLGLCIGCASVKVVHRAPEFDSASLASGGLGIGAVAGLGGGEYLLADNVSRLLSQELAQEYPGLAVLPLEEILKKVRPRYPGHIIEVELERESDLIYYEIEIVGDDGVVYELEIDAKTGDILKTDVEGD